MCNNLTVYIKKSKNERKASFSEEVKDDLLQSY